MAAVSLLNVEVLKKVAEVTAPLELEITFECLEPLQKGNWTEIGLIMCNCALAINPLCPTRAAS